MRAISTKRWTIVTMMNVAAACTALAGGPVCAQSPVRGAAVPTGAEATIRAARMAQNRAMATMSLDSAASFWTDDVTLRRGLGPASAGRAAYRALLDTAGLGESALIYQRRTSEVTVSSHWPLAFESGTWIGHTGGADGPAAIRGRYSAQWVQRDGRWLIRSEVFVALTCAGVGCRAVAAP